MRKSLFVASALAALVAGPALASNDASPFATPKLTAPASQYTGTVERGYSAADDFRLSSKDAFPARNVGAGQSAGNIDSGFVTSGVPGTTSDAATQQFKISND
ncbi:hypothetical protein [Chelativorans sp. J32]|uniref:hypothetical protein n=1 Tax=Chelativorans sp. J32 TaxID=935840 RepID=UPI00047F289D|nr:hypothetical protein [Chelativorans sp. J32]